MAKEAMEDLHNVLYLSWLLEELEMEMGAPREQQYGDALEVLYGKRQRNRPAHAYIGVSSRNGKNRTLRVSG